MNHRKTAGVCRCIKNFEHFKVNDIYTFEYKPDENNCWLYYLTHPVNGIVELCNWSFFDDMFEVVE